MSLPISRRIAATIASFSKMTFSAPGARLVLMAAFLPITAAFASAQQVYEPVMPASVTTPIPFTTQDGDNIESVNPDTGSLHIEIPLQGVDRHGKPFVWKMVYNTPTFYFQYFPGDPPPTQPGQRPASGFGQQWALFPTELDSPGEGISTNWNLYVSNDWGYSFQGPPPDINSNPPTCYYYTNMVGDALYTTNYIWDDFLVYGPDGATHPTNLYVSLQGSQLNGGYTGLYYSPCGSQQTQLQSYTTDGSGIFVDLAAGTARLKDGTLVGHGNSWQIGSNSPSPNQWMFGAMEDANGNLAPGDEVANFNSPGAQLHDANGNTQNVQFEESEVNIVANDCGTVLLLPVAPCVNFGTQSNVGVLSKIILPNGQYYQFGYAPNGHGELTSLRLPSGATITYTYSPTLYSDSGLRDQQSRYEHPSVQSRTITANGVSKTWQYSVGSLGLNINLGTTSTVTDPNGNCTEHNSTYFGQVGYGSLTETSSAVYSGGCGSGSPLTTTTTDFQFDSCSGGCIVVPPSADTSMPVANIRPVRVSTTIGGLTKKTETDYESDPVWAGSRELPIEVREFDFGATTPTRVTDYIYLHNPTATPESCAGNAQTFSELPASQYLALNIVDRPIKKTVCDGAGNLLSQTNYEYDNYSTAMQLPSGVGLHDPAYNASMTSRGNLTATSVWNNNGGWITTHYQYDALGNKTAVVDPKGNTTTYSYADLFSNSSCLPLNSSNQPLPLYAYPTTVTNALGQQAQTHYTSCTGQVAQGQDPNDLAQGRAGTVTTFDLMDHPTSVTYPDGGVTTYDYGNYALPLTITETHAPVGSTVSVLDDLGRLTTQTLATGARQDKTYDALDNVLSVSNWYYPGATSPTDGYTSYAYDALNRPLLVCNPDNGTPAGYCTTGSSYKQTSYNGNTVTSIDEAGNTWAHTTDAFGDLTQVVEPGSLTTLYSYDSLGRLVSVNQQGGSGDTARTRSFSYDSLSRLTSSTNPETGTIGYTYDANSNLLAKTDARGITTAYSYDALNRLHLKTYSTGDWAVGLGYDGNAWDGSPLPSNYSASTNVIGRLTYASHFAQADVGYGYDAMGRVTSESYCLPDNCGNRTQVSAQYDLAGNMTDLTYPDGRHIQQTFDSAGRLSGSNMADINGVSQTASYLQSISYLPDGSPGMTTLGNGVQQTIAKNNRLQVQRMAVSSPLSPFENQAFLSHTYCYVNCATGGAANNGNIWAITDTLNAAKTQGFTYDSLNRISSFSLGGALNQQFQVDSFGNMSPAVGGDPISTFDPATNRINNLPCASAFTPFDAGGNQLCSTDQYGGISQYSYDAENRISQIGTLNSASPFVSYVYGADGARVRKSNADGTFTEYVDFGGQPIAEKDENGNWTDYIYAGGKKVASVPGADRVFHTSVVASGSGGLARFDLAIPQNPTGGNYTVQAGDRLCWRQNGQAVYSGMAVWFNNGEDTILQQVYASDGQLTHYRSPSPGWANRCIDLTVGGSDTNAQIVHLALLSYDFTGTSTDWDVYYADMSITSVNGQVIPIINGALPSSASASALNETNLSSDLESNPTVDAGAQVATHFLLGDHLGTAQLELSAGGWPVYHGQFAPYGQELQANGSLLAADAADGSANHYKFTGKERDAESGLDYFGARYYASSMGRWMSPDWSAKEDPVPYAKLDNPQSLNLYGYVLNNPLSTADADGHVGCCTLADLEELVNKGTEEGRQMIAAAAPAVVAGAETLGEITVSTALAPVVAIGGLIASPQAAGNWNDDHPTAQTRNGRPPSESNPVITSSNIGPKAGESGGPGAGKAIPDKTKAAALDENKAANGGQAKCVFCGEPVGPGTKNKINYDHAQNKANGGTSGLNNTNVACEYCNKSKGTGTAPKNPKQPNQN